MPSSPFVSVIIPTQNRPHRLQRALESVLEQTFDDVEIVVVNDGGLPVSRLVNAFRSQVRFSVHLVTLHARHGPACARNAGVSAASGDLIALLDDDDLFYPEHLNQLTAALQAHPEATIVYDDVLISVEDGSADDPRPHIIATCRFGRDYDKVLFERNDYIVPSSVVLRRSDFDKVGGFDETMALCEDWDFLMRLRERGTFHYVQRAIGVEYSIRPAAKDNLSGNFDEARRRALDLISARYGLPPLAPKTFLDIAHELGFEFQPKT